MQIKQHNTHNSFETLFSSVLKHGEAIFKNTYVYNYRKTCTMESDSEL